MKYSLLLSADADKRLIEAGAKPADVYGSGRALVELTSAEEDEIKEAIGSYADGSPYICTVFAGSCDPRYRGIEDILVRKMIEERLPHYFWA